MEEDYYTILGVSRTATKEEIDKVYRKKALDAHPDRHAGSNEAFVRLKQAHDVLRDNEKRKEYDKTQGKNRGQKAQPEENIADEYGDILKTWNARRKKPQFKQQPTFNDIKAEASEQYLQLSLEELWRGGTKTVEVERTREGEKETVAVEVEIPRGCKAGSRILCAEQGDQINAVQPPGDVIFIVTEHGHSRFRREGDNLLYQAPVPLCHALLGDHSVEIKCMDDSVVLCEADNTVWGAGKQWIFTGKGMPKADDPGCFGDLVVTVLPILPERLSTHQRQLLAQLNF